MTRDASLAGALAPSLPVPLTQPAMDGAVVIVRAEVRIATYPRRAADRASLPCRRPIPHLRNADGTPRIGPRSTP